SRCQWLLALSVTVRWCVCVCVCVHARTQKGTEEHVQCRAELLARPLEMGYITLLWLRQRYLLALHFVCVCEHKATPVDQVSVCNYHKTHTHTGFPHMHTLTVTHT